MSPENRLGNCGVWEKPFNESFGILLDLRDFIMQNNRIIIILPYVGHPQRQFEITSREIKKVTKLFSLNQCKK